MMPIRNCSVKFQDITPEELTDISVAEGSIVATHIVEDIADLDLSSAENRQRLEEYAFWRLAVRIVEHQGMINMAADTTTTFNNLDSEGNMKIKIEALDTETMDDEILAEGQIALDQGFRHDRNTYTLKKSDNGQMFLTIRDIFDPEDMVIISLPAQLDIEAVKKAAELPHSSRWTEALEPFKASITGEF